VVITPAMVSGSCLGDIFEKFPKRSFDVGITEEHAMTFAAGLSNANKKPYITLYSSFLQRAYDQINHDIARMNLPCLVGVDRSGLVGADGETHHGVFDISFLSAIPNIVYMTPRNAKEARMMVNTAFVNFDRPYFVRFPRGQISNVNVDIHDTLTVGSWEKVIYDTRNSLTIITYDMKVDAVLKVINDEKLSVNLINARFIKPMDNDLLDELYQDHQKLIVYETDLMIGSLGTMIAHYYSVKHFEMNIDYLAIDDTYTPQGDVKSLLKREHVSIEDLLLKVKGKLI
ncbi:MAG: transketolase C-terminal domain-containing protein, partial [Coprobacillus sp.]